MSEYIIPIKNMSDVHVADLIWDGELYDGEAKIAPLPGYENEARRAADIINVRRDLAGIRFRSAGSRPEVQGWFGYEGVIGAMRIVLPAVGLRLSVTEINSPPLERQRQAEWEQNHHFGDVE